MASCEVTVRGGRGIMIAMNHRLVQAVVNRCRMPGDSDILVPIRTVSVIGTTDSPIDDPDDTSIPAAEIQQMIDDGAEMIPHLADARALRVWAGVRPLYERQGGGQRRHPRHHAQLRPARPPRARRRSTGFITITGGKLTTARLMGEKTVDAVVRAARRHRAVHHRRRAAARARRRGARMQVTDRLARREENAAFRAGDLRVRAGHAAACCSRPRPTGPPTTSTICAARCGSAWARARAGSASPAPRPRCVAADRMDAPTANRAIESFSEERWKGVWPLLDGRQARQARLDEWLTDGALDIRHLPHERGRS